MVSFTELCVNEGGTTELPRPIHNIEFTIINSAGKSRRDGDLTREAWWALWREVTEPTKTHNDQMTVVVALWEAGLIL